MNIVHITEHIPKGARLMAEELKVGMIGYILGPDGTHYANDIWKVAEEYDAKENKVWFEYHGGDPWPGDNREFEWGNAEHPILVLTEDWLG